MAALPEPCHILYLGIQAVTMVGPEHGWQKVTLHWESSKYSKGLTALAMSCGTTLGEEGSAVAHPATNTLIAVSKYSELRRSHLLIQFSLLTRKL